jgi:hypothetical protein
MEVRFVKLVIKQPKDLREKWVRPTVKDVVEFSQYTERPSFIGETCETVEYTDDCYHMMEFRINFNEFRKERTQAGGIHRRTIQKIMKILNHRLDVSDDPLVKENW